MGRRWIVAATATLLLALLPASSGADAPSVGIGAAFKLEGTHGYSILAYAFSDRLDGRGSLSLWAHRGGGSASYVAPATVTPTAIHADLGSLGEIDVELKPSGREKTVHPKCAGERTGKPITYEPGVYEGTLAFNGEEGFTRVREAQTPLSVLSVAALVCSGGGSSEAIGFGLPGARLKGFSFAHRRKLGFQVNKNRPGSRVRYSASIYERHEGILIEREVIGTAPPRAFDFVPTLRTAALSPPAPFSGSATFRRTRNDFVGSWMGDLAVDFPGRSNVRLAGPGVHASLAHARFSSDSSIAFRGP